MSSFRFKGANPDVETIGRKLNVANLLEGSVRRDGRRLRIGVQLVDAQSGFQRWSAAYERQMDDIFAVQDDIARSVVAALQITLLASPASIVSLQTKNPEAYTAVLQARHFWTRRGPGDLERAAASFRKAIELDPGYANAWVGLAETHHRQADNGDLPVEEGYRMARQEVERALALAPGLAYAHAEMGWIRRAHDWDWEGADAAYQRALALEPGSRAAVVGASVLAFTLGRLDEAIGLDARAIELDPLSVGPRINLGIHLLYAGRLDEAAAAFNKALELSPDYPITRACSGGCSCCRAGPRRRSPRSSGSLTRSGAATASASRTTRRDGRRKPTPPWPPSSRTTRTPWRFRSRRSSPTAARPTRRSRGWTARSRSAMAAWPT